MRHAEDHSRARRAGVLAVTAGLALLTAACGGSTPTSAGGSSFTGASTAHQKELAFARCMRTHGVPGFPDPGSGGLLQVSPGMSQSPQYQTAYQACRSLRPAHVPLKGVAPGGSP